MIRVVSSLAMRVVMFILALSACSTATSSSSPADASLDGGGRDDAPLHPAKSGGPACRDYPDAGLRRFPVLSSSASVPAQLPLCTPSCHPHLGAAGTGDAPSDQDLPSGPCDDDGAACSNGLASQSCGVCRYSGGPGTSYVCACRAHRWQCAIAEQGAATCAPPACLATDPTDPTSTCDDVKRTTTQVCACGVCHALCASDADCATGTCHLGEICAGPDTCAGPDECIGTCTGFCR